MKLSKRLIKELMEAGAEYDEAVEIAMKGTRLERVTDKQHLNNQKRQRRDNEDTHRRP